MAINALRAAEKGNHVAVNAVCVRFSQFVEQVCAGVVPVLRQFCGGSKTFCGVSRGLLAKTQTVIVVVLSGCSK